MFMQNVGLKVRLFYLLNLLARIEIHTFMYWVQSITDRICTVPTVLYATQFFKVNCYE